MTAINKKVLSEIIASEHHLTKKEAASIVDLLFDTISDTLKDGNKVEISGFGKFEVTGQDSCIQGFKEPERIREISVSMRISPLQGFFLIR